MCNKILKNLYISIILFFYFEIHELNHQFEIKKIESKKGKIFYKGQNFEKYILKTLF
jgi:hypothetical protein